MGGYSRQYSRQAQRRLRDADADVRGLIAEGKAVSVASGQAVLSAEQQAADQQALAAKPEAKAVIRAPLPAEAAAARSGEIKAVKVYRIGEGVRVRAFLTTQPARSLPYYVYPRQSARGKGFAATARANL